MLVIGNGQPERPEPSAPVASPSSAPSPKGAAVFAANASLAVYRRIATFFVLFTAGLVALVCYMVFTRATVVVMSAPQEVNDDFLVDVSKAPTEGELGGGVYELTDSLTRTFPASSLVDMAVAAEGRVRIESRLSRSQTLVATTRLLAADGRLFRTKKTVVVPAGGGAEVDVFATVSGKEGEADEADFSIPGLNDDVRRFFRVKVVAPISGGTRNIRAVTAEDAEKAKAALVEELSRTLKDRLRASAAAGGTVAGGEFLTVTTLSDGSSVPPGQEAESFDMTVQVKAVGVFYDKKAFRDAVRADLERQLPVGRTVSEVKEQDADIRVEKTDLAAGRATLRVAVRGTSVLSQDNPSLDPSKIAGITADAAKRYLEKLEGVSSASVTVSPIWSSRLPQVTRRIRVEVR